LPHVTPAEVPDAVRGAFAELPRVLRRHGRAVVHRTGTPERDIPRNRVSSRAHGFSDLISYQNDRKDCTAIAGKVENA
jgi:hypothetical protein